MSASVLVCGTATRSRPAEIAPGSVPTMYPRLARTEPLAMDRAATVCLAGLGDLLSHCSLHRPPTCCLSLRNSPHQDSLHRREPWIMRYSNDGKQLKPQIVAGTCDKFANRT